MLRRMSTLPALALPVLATMVLTMFAPGPARADVASIPIQETGIVDWVQDGDTFRFIEDGQSNKVSVRLLGINTPEVAGFQNEHFAFDFCGGIPAQSLLKQILPQGTRVQLRAFDKNDTNRGRPLRWVYAFNPATGQYDIDVQAEMLKAGLAMWFTLDSEKANSTEYRALVDAAQAAGVGIWNPAFCGPVEQPDAKIGLTVVWDAPENDAMNINGEYTIVRNNGSTPVDLSGWLLRDSSLEAWYTFPPGSVLAPGDYVTVHVGSGTAGSPDPHDRYMNAPRPIFANAATSPTLIGDGAYLLDTKTAYRAWTEYPCTTDCADPAKGRVIISKVNPKAPPGPPAKRANAEYVVVKNTSAAPVDLGGYFLRRQISTYTFPPGTVIAPGKTIKVRIGRGTPTATTLYWGRPKTLLDDRGDSVQLVSPQAVVLSSKSWGKVKR